MKRNFLKMILPMAIITFGITSAMTTNKTETTKKVAPVMGYSHWEDEPCREEILCANTGAIPCKVGAVQLYAKSGATCPTPLFRN